MKPQDALKYIYLQTRKASLTAEEHDSCARLFNIVLAELEPKTSGEVKEKKKAK